MLLNNYNVKMQVIDALNIHSYEGCVSLLINEEGFDGQLIASVF